MDDARYVLDPDPHRGRLRRAGRVPDPGAPGSSARASGSPGCARWTWRPAARFEIRAQQVVNATGVWTDEIQAMVGGRGMINLRVVQGRAPGRAPGPDPVPHRDHRAHPGQRAVHHPVGPALDHRHHRHRLGAGTRPHPAASRADIDYVLGQVEPGARGPADQGRRRSACTPGCGRCWPASPTPPPGCPASTWSPTRCPAWCMIAGGKYTTYRLMARDAVDAVAHGLDWRVPPSCTDRGAAGRGGRLPGAVERPAPAGPVVGPARGPDRAPAAAGTAR